MNHLVIDRIALIGAGRIAWHLGFAIQSAGLQVQQVFNRTPAAGRLLAEKLSAEYISDISCVSPEIDLCIVCLSDHAIHEVLENVALKDQLLVHTSGSQPMEILSEFSRNYGVFYPVQTFGDRQQLIDFSAVPVCVEANTENGLQSLLDFSRKLSDVVQTVDSVNRQRVHLAAVFANNFTNFMCVIAEDLLRGYNINTEMLLPLIRQTCSNFTANNFFDRQTGPAVRDDQNTISSHLKLLESNPGYRNIYFLLSESIRKYKEQHG
jgi:predicted short-subunit dehydrogenase-like oxidoreductase (DUF2520 family)